MLIRELLITEKLSYTAAVKHIMQSWGWGETRELMGKEVHRYGLFNDMGTMFDGYQLSIHNLPSPLSNWKIGYLPKSVLPDAQMIHALSEFGKSKGIIFFKIEPNVYAHLDNQQELETLKSLQKSIFSLSDRLVKGKDLFTQYNFLLDLTASEDQLLARMHQKTRYNIGLAQRKGVQVEIRTDEQAFQTFLKIYFETTTRQGYFGHDVAYHTAVWNTLRRYDLARILIATYDNTPVTAWMLFNYNNTLYYPYGGSRVIHREMMASNLVAWEAIRLGKSMGLSTFDLWGAMGPEPDTTDPYYGFHRFKLGYGPNHIAYVGGYDLIVNPQYYALFLKLDKYRSKALRLKAMLRKHLPFLK